MGPPRSMIITAIGDTVNTTARLESLTKEYGCPLIISRRAAEVARLDLTGHTDRKSTRLNSSHANISYAVFCLKKKNTGGAHEHAAVEWRVFCIKEETARRRGGGKRTGNNAAESLSVTDNRSQCHYNSELE